MQGRKEEEERGKRVLNSDSWRGPIEPLLLTAIVALLWAHMARCKALSGWLCDDLCHEPSFPLVSYSLHKRHVAAAG